MSTPAIASPVAVVETSLYADDLLAMKAFYATVLGLPVVAEDLPRHVFLRVGEANMLLLFNPVETMKGDQFPDHGTRGAGHVALGIPLADLQSWRERLQQHGVAIELEHTWPLGGKSLYFRDPAGNSLELITPGVWGTPAGW